jgi:two-component system, NarL family, invasion response regulator UvrY
MNTGSTEPVWILVVDDHPLARLGVRQLLAGERDLRIGWETDSIEAALFVARTAKIDLAMVGASMGTIDSIELIRRLREIKPQLPVLAYSQHDLRFAELAFTAGASGYAMKQDSPERLIEAIREVLAGRKYVSQGLEPT